MEAEDNDAYCEEEKKIIRMCEVCNVNPFKYTCPGCNKRTCSLVCAREHKRNDNCSGVRNLVKFVAMADYNDVVLHNDYQFLSEVARKVGSSLKGIADFPAWSTPHMVEEASIVKKRDTPSYLSTLIKQAELRKTKLIILPLGMSRQKENSTRYLFREGIISWYTKWILSSISPALAFSAKISELDNIGEILIREIGNLSNHLFPLVAKYKGVSLDNIIILMEKYHPFDESTSSNNVMQQDYYIVPSNHTFRDVFAGVCILEFPVFHVIFPADLPKYSVHNLPMLPLDPWMPPVKLESKSVKRGKLTSLSKDEDAKRIDIPTPEDKTANSLQDDINES